MVALLQVFGLFAAVCCAVVVCAGALVILCKVLTLTSRQRASLEGVRR